MYVPKSPIAPLTSAHFDRKTRLFFNFLAAVVVVCGGDWWLLLGSMVVLRNVMNRL
ncbi:hypothetical protein HanPSC8_Chr03g0134371 [Helianthus annuus]|nr:hypothetical protein HanPSC8_Chr03g0134371 [Helianthus annuus]